MKYQRLFFLCCICIVSLLPQFSHACSTICLDNEDELVVGKNFDWMTGDALIIVNKRNVSKTANLDPNWTEEQPASWVSKYGSVTFNPFGREFPLSGMNEAGLVVSAMLLSLTEYPAPDARPTISSAQWVQYQLDTFATVADVIASDAVLRISNSDLTLLHFFVCDSTGTCATIEFIDGELVYHTQETLPVKVLTNETYDICLDYWENNKTPPPDPAEKIHRFITAAQMLEDYDPATSEPAVDYTLYVLSNLTWKNQWMAPTQWSIAFDIPNQRISFHTLDNADIRYFHMNSFDFSCSSPVKVLDVQEDLSGDVSGDFIDYTYEINRDLIEKTYALYDLTDEVLDALAGYPEDTECTALPSDVILKGPGMLDVIYAMNEQDIARIELTGTTEASSLTIKSKLKNTAVFLDGLNVAGSLKAIKGKSVVLTGEMTATGGIGKMQIAGTNTGSSIEASWMSKLSIAEDFAGDLILTGAGTPAKDLTLGKLSIKGTLNSSEVRVNGNVGSVKVGTWGAGSTLAVGVDPGGDGQFFTNDDFATGGWLGKIKYNYYETDNDGAAFGIIADEFSKLKATLPFEEDDFCIWQK